MDLIFKMEKMNKEDVLEIIWGAEWIVDYKIDYENKRLYLFSHPKLTEIEDWGPFEEEVFELFGEFPTPADYSENADEWFLEFEEIGFE